MVLQQGKPVPVWGWAPPGTSVTVAIAGRSRTTKTDAEGSWRVTIGPMEAGGPFEMTVRADEEITFSNVLVGEVWVCSGQSNMQWWVGVSANADQEIRNADYDRIRLFSVPTKASIGPQEDVNASWLECRPDAVRDFSAVAYFFGRELHRELGVPVGLIHSSWGGTLAEAWMSRSALESNPSFRPILDRFEREVQEHPDLIERFDSYHATWARAQEAFQQKQWSWLQAFNKAQSEGETLSVPPPLPPELPGDHNTPTGLYNAMIHPLIPCAMRGVIWYQGESNIERAYQYRELFPALIRQWRSDWDGGDFPFLFVQLANWQPPGDHFTRNAWAELREAQLMTLARVPDTGMAVAIDIGDVADIHPKNKQDVGRRLALVALAKVYGRDLVYSGPIYQSMTKEAGGVRLRFEHVGGGLAAKGGTELAGFRVAGTDRRFRPAKAQIDGETVFVRSDGVPDPVAVRYAWADNPVCNLCNKEGLPASPFRTDDWPGITVENR